jgi:glycosyltransferase involved in cell wall biosynthesis
VLFVRTAMKVALVHDWLITWRGGEKVLSAIAELYPDAPIYTLFHEPGSMKGGLEERRIITSWLDRLPGSRQRHRELLPLMPQAIWSMELEPVDLVISSSHCAAKAVRAPNGARHLSYVHAPLRYMWDRFDDYFGPGKASPAVRAAARLARPALQAWDVLTATGVDRFVANSRHVATQIASRYHRHAAVIPPPVELERFVGQSLEGTGQGGYFLALGALAPYKRIDLAIEAFRRTGQPLWIGGTGQASKAWLSSLPPNVKVLGQVPDHELPALYRGARALLFPGVEDFGLTPLESLASGRPVIALRQGGVLDTLDEKTALFFEEQTVEGLVDALARFDAWERTFRPAAARERALRFTKAAFQAAFQAQVGALGL